MRLQQLCLVPFVLLIFILLGCNNEKGKTSSAGEKKDSGIVIADKSIPDSLPQENISSIDSLPGYLNRKLPLAKVDKIVKIDSVTDKKQKYYLVNYLDSGRTKLIILQTDSLGSILKPFNALYCRGRADEINCIIRLVKETKDKPVYFECPCENSFLIAHELLLNNLK